MKRIVLFLLTNLAIMLVVSAVWTFLQASGVLAGSGELTSLLVFCALFGFGGSFVSLALSKPMAKAATGAKVISEPRGAGEMWLLETVRKQSQAAGIGMPEVAIFPSPAPNAFATGMRRNKALVAVSTGLLQNMDRNEVEAVLGHEISHVSNGDMVTLSLIQGVVNTFVYFLARVLGDIIDRAVFRNEGQGRGIGYFGIVMMLQVVLGIAASLIVFWFSRRREFRADAGGARLAGRENMIRALERLQVASGAAELPERMQAFGISNKARGGIARWFMTHPPLEERIEALRSLQA